MWQRCFVRAGWPFGAPGLSRAPATLRTLRWKHVCGERPQQRKRLLDDRHFESLRLNEDNAKKGDSNVELRLKASDLDKEIEVIKLQRQDNWREIAKLKDLNEQRVREAAAQADNLKGLDYDLSRVHLRIEDT